MPKRSEHDPAQPNGRPIPTDPLAVLYAAEAAYLLGLSPRTLEGMRLRGGGPNYLALSRSAVRYRRADIESWQQSRVRHSTSDAA